MAGLAEAAAAAGVQADFKVAKHLTNSAAATKHVAIVTPDSTFANFLGSYRQT
jgi:hypothetical protein